MIKATIMEINPFHNGHEYFLKQIPKDNGDILIVITSTSIVQRGEFTVLNKHTKAELLLDNNVDIVIELPSLYANQGANHFAYHALNILKEFKIEELYFGSESCDLNKLKNFNPENNSDFKSGIYQEELSNMNSNDILGIAYLRAIKDLNINVQPCLVKRIANNYNDESINSSIASATSIRKNLGNIELVKDTLPSKSLNNIQILDETALFAMFVTNMDIYLQNNLTVFLSQNNELLQKLNKYLIKHPEITTVDELAYQAADRNNSKYKLKRVIMNTILGAFEEDYTDQFDYIHLLGFTRKGQQYIKQLELPNLVGSLKNETSKLAQYELRASRLYNILSNQTIKHDYLPPKIKSC